MGKCNNSNQYNQAKHPYNYQISHKHIKITNHAKIRAIERLHITSDEELKKLAKSAKYKGLNINTLRNSLPNPKSILSKYHLNPEDVDYFLSRYHESNRRTYYYYKDNIWVFNGKKSSNVVLLSIIPCSEEDRKIGNEVANKGLENFLEENPDTPYYKTLDDIKIDRLWGDKNK